MIRCTNKNKKRTFTLLKRLQLIIIICIAFLSCNHSESNHSKLEPAPLNAATSELLKDSITIPIYSIDSTNFSKFLLLSELRTKIVVVPFFETSSINFQNHSALILYGIKKKETEIGVVDFEKFKDTVIAVRDTSLKFYPFLISNLEIRARKLENALKNKSYKKLLFVPSIEKTEWDGLYHLNFTIYTGTDISSNKVFVSNLILSFNPSPPSKPADSRQ